MTEAKELVIKKVAMKSNLSVETVEKIYSFQFKDVVEHTKTCNTIEISGLCRLIASKTKIQKRIILLTNAIEKYKRKLEEPNTLNKTLTLQTQIETATEQVKVLNKKLNNES